MEVLTEQDVKRMQLPDLRIALRSRGLTPAGGIEALRLRLVEYIQAVESGMIESAAPHGAAPPVQATYYDPHEASRGAANNNYARQDGQNLGNFLTDRNSSRVLAPPGGASSITFGSAEPAGSTHQQRFSVPDAPPYVQHAQYAAPHHGGGGGGAADAMYGGGYADPQPIQRQPAQGGGGGFMGGASRGNNNNYARQEGQNLGNFLTDRNSSRVLAPPGGASSIRF